MNNNFMRQGSGNRNRNRNNNNNNNRNRHRNSGGNGGGGPNNKVFDSNGPDVKVRGTAQTIAEKYMQLGRDAQSSGDGVAAESYYQHAEHYYRMWASNQPAGSSLIMSRKFGEEEFEDENGEDLGDEEVQELVNVEGALPENAAGQEPAPVDGQQDGQSQQRRFNNRPRDDQQRDRTGDGGRERFRPKWQRGRDRYNNPDGSGEAQPVQENGSLEAPVAHEFASVEARPEEPRAIEPRSVEPRSAEQWEAPSFLQRPAPVSVAEAPVTEGDAAPVKRTRTRRPRVEEQPAASDEPAAPTE